MSSPASSSKQNKIEEEVEDPVELMLKKTGCLEKHYMVQECIAETKDWRKCQNVVSEFRDCMEEHKKRQSKLAQ